MLKLGNIKNTLEAEKLTHLIFTFGRFLGVGLSGIGVNLFTLWALVFFQTSLLPLVAAILATEVSIIWNFLLHDFWTFNSNSKSISSLQRDQNQGQGRNRAGATGSKERSYIFNRFARFQVISAVGAVISLGLFWVFNTELHLFYLLAQLFAIGLTTVFNFFLNARFTWGWFTASSETEAFSESAG